MQEWMEDWDDSTDHHRPSLAKAALISLNSRGDSSVGWSSAWKINLYARLQQGNRAYQMVQSLFRHSISYNLLDTYPPFQIDANFGYTAGLSEMLLQSHTGEIDLLPALPDAWRQGLIKGLKARGNVEVSLFWKDGQLQKAILKAAKSGSYRIRYGRTTKTIELLGGKAYQFNAQLQERQFISR
ncbi:hypothetical protein FW778_00500 [Ginsengibacter hankyongi]|uniref:Alpha-L-fucosidase n=1 Tax=Ginsengibacter hankyongi TaxID=2607284 RepID=A0A5J5IHU2_9BACT|nr:hypothetical protein [Ginsengibacter hankyongi]KAA9040559.1 hypothetical protein FW778_00500 [Ginsengibacter hankyongi]